MADSTLWVQVMQLLQVVPTGTHNIALEIGTMRFLTSFGAGESHGYLTYMESCTVPHGYYKVYIVNRGT